MRWLTGLLLTSLVSISVTYLLMWLYEEQTRDVLAFQERNLYEHNLVDQLQKLPLSLEIYKVNLSHAILLVDLKVAEDRVPPAVIYEDFMTLSYFGLVDMENVNEVLIRVFAANQDELMHGQFMLAMDGKREDWSAARYDLFVGQRLTAEQFLKSQFTWVKTRFWDKYVQ